jgi:hypothetical protein
MNTNSKIDSAIRVDTPPSTIFFYTKHVFSQNPLLQQQRDANIHPTAIAAVNQDKTSRTIMFFFVTLTSDQNRRRSNKLLPAHDNSAATRCHQDRNIRSQQKK